MEKLNIKQVEVLQPKSKPYRVADGDGLTLQVNPDGKKKWLYRYRLGFMELFGATGRIIPIREMASTIAT